jgi:transposase-like protein
MTTYQLTIDQELAQGLLSGTASESGLRSLLEQVLNQVLEAQVSEQLGATRYERTEERQGYRNGVRPRRLTTRVGPLTLRVPQVREGEFSTELFARYQRSEQALVLALMEMVVNGVSTRKVTQITEELCGASFSKSTVSALCAQLDPLVSAWNERPLGEQAFPFVLVDALVLKVREDERVRALSGLLAIGVNAAGSREILGLQLGDSEAEASWSSFLGWLKRRGLTGVDLVVSDAHGGLVNAIQRHFQGATWQRCQTHLTRDVLEVTPKAIRDELHAQLRALFEAPDLATARTLLRQITATFAERAPKAVTILEAGFDDATAVLALPDPYRRRLRTTNSVERLNEEIRRRERVIRIFPNRPSAIRLLGAFLLEQHEQWTTGHHYLDMAAYWQWRREQPVTTALAREVLMPMA